MLDREIELLKLDVGFVVSFFLSEFDAVIVPETVVVTKVVVFVSIEEL